MDRGGVITSYGLWPDGHPDVPDNGAGTDIRIGREPHADLANRYYLLNPDQEAELESLLGQNVTWRYTNTCASWASETVNAVTGEDVDADDWAGFETPREITRNIEILEMSNPTSPGAPNVANEADGSSSW